MAPEVDLRQVEGVLVNFKSRPHFLQIGPSQNNTTSWEPTVQTHEQGRGGAGWGGGEAPQHERILKSPSSCGFHQ